MGHTPSFERAREQVSLAAFEPRPEADVAGACVLRLKAAHPLESPRDRELHALEQELAREERAVQLPFREDTLGHAAK
jgi:hypothetical protein